MLSELTIPKAGSRELALDNVQLYALGIEKVQNLSKQLWTDFNVHDPGVTTLEILCFALTDLSYRASMPIEDLLATETDNESNMKDQFFTAREILPSRPVTLLDFRKLIIDLEGVKNAWITPAPIGYYADTIHKELLESDPGTPGIVPVEIEGLYTVLIDYMGGLSNSRKDEVLADVEDVLQENRNLCEDFVSYTGVDTQEFVLCGEFELRADADTARTMAIILFEVQQFLAPTARNYTLDEMLAKNKKDGSAYTSDEIFSGPALNYGFIPDEELDDTDLKDEIRLSDIINIIMDIPGVVAIRDLVVNPKELTEPLENKWVVSVDKQKKISLSIESSRLVFYKRGMPIVPDDVEVVDLYGVLEEQERQKLEIEQIYDFAIPLGKYRSHDSYYASQNHFPEIYGLSENGLPASASDTRKVQVLQLKAYLLFFDQLMANYFSHLTNVREFFSIDPELLRTYFYQRVDTFKDWQKIYLDDDADSDTDPDPVKLIRESVEDEEEMINRRNRFLDHLISRFAEQFTEYANIMYSEFDSGPEVLVRQKCDFLKCYPVISSERGLAYNYTLKKMPDIWNSENISGLEKRLCKLLGINNSRRRNLSDITYDIYAEIDTTPGDEFRFRIRDRVGGDILLSSVRNFVTKAQAKAEMRRAIIFASLSSSYQKKITIGGRFYFNVVDDDGVIVARRIEYFDTQVEMESAIAEVIEYLQLNYSEEGMYLVENILLRPEQTGDPFMPICLDANCEDCSDADPYSYRIQIILPAYGIRFTDMDFRNYAEEVIRTEVPAHILPKVCWISKDDMAVLEKVYQDWLKLKCGRTSANRVQKLGRIIKALTEVKNVYPTERLRECDADESQSKFIVGRKSLGSLE